MFNGTHYNDVIMGAMASQITSLTIVYSIVYSVADKRKYQTSALLAFVWGIHRSPVNSPHKGPVTGKMFPFHDVIMWVQESANATCRLKSLLSNYIHWKVWDKTIYSFPSVNVATVAILVFSSHIYWPGDYLSVLGWKLIHVSKRAHGHYLGYHPSTLLCG